MSFEQGSPKLGVRSDDRTPQTLRAFGRQELPPSPFALTSIKIQQN